MNSEPVKDKNLRRDLAWAGAFVVGIILTFAAVDVATDMYDTSKGGWYLVCSDSTQDYLVKTDSKPYTRDGFIYINDKAFITPNPMMTCSRLRGEEVEKAIDDAKNVKADA